MTPMWWTRVLTIGARGPDVEVVQRKLGIIITGEYDYPTAISVRGWQDVSGLPRTGEVDEQTARAIGPRARDHLAPEWYEGEPIHDGDQLWDEVMGDRDADWLRRFQSQHEIPPTGFIDEPTSLLLGQFLPERLINQWEST